MREPAPHRVPVFVPPEELDGYRIVRKLGAGAMGEVYLGHDTILDRPVAIKFLAGVEPDARARERFLIEARAIARLQHPNVVGVYRVGHGGGRPYLVSELVRGRNLAEIARPVEGERVRDIAVQLARGLAAAHRRGVLHRDIKPANVMIDDQGVIKLCDFGLAKLLGDGDGVGPGARAAAAPVAPDAATARAGAPAGPVDGADATVDRMDQVNQVDTAGTTAGDPGATLDATADAPARPATLTVTVSSSEALGPPSSGSPQLTEAGRMIGTPLYMAPEAWRGEPATARSDLYSLGALLYELCAGRPPHRRGSIAALREQVTAGEHEPLLEAAPGVDPPLAAVVERLLARDPALRFESADALLTALVPRAPASAPLPAGNPYRGLAAFEAEHRALFFGRGADVRAIVDLLRSEPLVVVAGDSGVGKSSLCRAGVLPQVEAGALGERTRWLTVSLMPGAAPHTALVATLERELGVPLTGDEPREVAAALRAGLPADTGLCVLIDQLEELVTQAGADERDAAGALLASLAVGIAGVRVLVTARGDFLARLAGVPGLGAMLARGLYLLGPLDRDALREVVVGPARALGVGFESETMIAALVDSTADAGSLPLLQFALAELWQRRDPARSIIPARALDDIGGVTGALARHGDDVIDRLLPAERPAARRILTQLVTGDDTRARLTAAELGVGEGADGASAPAARALDALVRGRLVVVRQRDDGEATYELAHEALLDGWASLRGWLDADGERRAARERVRAAAAEWERLARARGALWGEPQLGSLAAADVAPAELPARERQFVLASRRAIRRRRWRGRAIALAIVALAAVIYGGVQWQARRALERRVDARLVEARTVHDQAAARDRAAAAARVAAFAAFGQRDIDTGEQTWSEFLRLAREADADYGRATRVVESALLLDHTRDDARALLVDLLLARALLAERRGDDAAAAERIARLQTYDADGRGQAVWNAPAEIRLDVTPPAEVRAARYRLEQGRRVLGSSEVLGTTPTTVTLTPGSYQLVLTAPGRPPVHYPLRARRGERRRVGFTIPARVPDGFVYVPPGRFVFGGAESEGLRRMFGTQPAHPVETDAYLIARHEVTYRAWIAFLEALPAGERLARTQSLPVLSLTRDAAGTGLAAWSIAMKPSQTIHRARAGEPIRYAGRDRRAEQDWLDMPAAGMRHEDAVAYVQWLDRSGRVPGARLCTEHEWERAARGADRRIYPHGDVLAADDANHDATYGRRSSAFGPDEVGAHPASRSPFGLDDLSGNVWEWVQSVVDEDELVFRGGGWYEGVKSAQVTNRSMGEPELRDHLIGLRVCAPIARP